jgi:hypothetical protein
MNENVGSELPKINSLLKGGERSSVGMSRYRFGKIGVFFGEKKKIRPKTP